MTKNKSIHPERSRRAFSKSPERSRRTVIYQTAERSEANPCLSVSSVAKITAEGSEANPCSSVSSVAKIYVERSETSLFLRGILIFLLPLVFTSCNYLDKK